MVWNCGADSTAEDGVLLGENDLEIMLTSVYEKAKKFNVRSILNSTDGPALKGRGALLLPEMHESQAIVRWIAAKKKKGKDDRD